MRNITAFSLICLLALAMSTAAGCATSDKAAQGGPGSGTPAEDPNIGPSTPTTVKIFQQYAGISDLEFNMLMKEPVEKKFPNITLELVRATSQVGPKELIAAGEFPDFIFTSSLNMLNFMEYDLPYDLRELIRKYNVDVHKYEPRAVREIQSFADNGQMLALPFSLNFGLLFYNKEIFDQIAVPYPKDGMTLEEVVQLAKTIGAKGGDKYAAYEPNSLARLSISMLLPKVDPATNKAVFVTEPWKKLFELYAEVRRIPGNSKSGDLVNRFLKDKNVAMTTTYGGVFGNMEELHKQGADMSFVDVVTFPLQPAGFPAKGLETEARLLIMSSIGKQKDVAFQVMNYLTSEDVQMKVARRAQLPGMKSDKTKELFGTDFESLKGKNVQAVFKNIYNDNPKPTRFDKSVETFLDQGVGWMIKENMDVNTALKRAEEAANQRIAELSQ
jgi:multiple sugar transport system substrate-binding protein